MENKNNNIFLGKIESGANFISGNEDRAQQALSTISRKINA